jgi:hypothetical protein
VAASAFGAILSRRCQAATRINPFAYDVDRFTRTDPNLVHYREINRFTPPQSGARRIVIGPNDRLYVGAGKSVSVLDAQAVVQSEIAVPDTVRCLAVTADGDLFVGLRDHVELFDAKGQRRASWSPLGPRAWLTGLAVSKTDVFLADAGNRVVLRCDRSGKVLGRIGEKNKIRNTPGLIVPSPFLDVEMHSDGLLRVNNPGRHRVEAYSIEGDLELAWGKASAAIDGFCGCCNPINLALLPGGKTLTCEKGLPRVKIYSADGTFEGVVAGVESFPENAKAGRGESASDGTHGGLDAAVDSRGQIYILDLVQGDIRVMAPKAGKAAHTPA